MVDVAQLFRPRAREDDAPLREAGVQPGEYAARDRAPRRQRRRPARACAALVDAAARASDLPVVLPLHPRTRARLEAAGLLDALAAATHVRVAAAARLRRLHGAARARRARC